MKTYSDVLNNMNFKVYQLAVKFEKLEKVFVETKEIVDYLIAFNEHREMLNLYHNFFAYCIRQQFDLDSEFIEILY
jgi:hypothetical protein